MEWLFGLVGLALGLVVGILAAGRLNVNPTRVRELEAEIRQLKDNHSDYRDSVSDHFSITAELVQQMTESYRDVYQHLASGAQDLCTSEVAGKLLPAESDAVFETKSNPEDHGALIPPRDYAAKQSPDQKGALAEDFGIEKATPVNDEEIALPQSKQ